jgi:hypothetical protein
MESRCSGHRPARTRSCYWRKRSYPSLRSAAIGKHAGARNFQRWNRIVRAKSLRITEEQIQAWFREADEDRAREARYRARIAFSDTCLRGKLLTPDWDFWQGLGRL